MKTIANNHERSAEDKLFSITTPLDITTEDNILNGSGFFYFEMPEFRSGSDNAKKYKDIWLATSRHVVALGLDDTLERVKQLEFRTRRIKDSEVSWNKIVLDKAGLHGRLRVHKDSTIDIAVIKVTDIIEMYHPNVENDIGFYAVSDSLLPENNSPGVEASDDVMTVGYPAGFHDEVNLYPIIRVLCCSL